MRSGSGALSTWGTNLTGIQQNSQIYNSIRVQSKRQTSAYLMVSHRLKASKGSSSFNIPPAKCINVGNQSDTCMSSRDSDPTTLLLKSLLCTKPTPRIAPSQSDPFEPRRGQLFPPFFVSPPLSARINRLIKQNALNDPVSLYKG